MARRSALPSRAATLRTVYFEHCVLHDVEPKLLEVRKTEGLPDPAMVWIMLNRKKYKLPRRPVFSVKL